jgi:Omp85 superfamily domain
VKKICLHIYPILIFITLVFPTQSSAQKGKKLFVDTLDNAFDLSNYLYNLNGFLPVLSPITEPAVGYGVAVAGLFFMEKKEREPGKFQMPDIIGLGGGLTENKTWFAGAGYVGFWKQDHIRYRGVFGYGDVKLKFYGGGDGFLNEDPAEFTLSSFFLLQQAIFRIGESRFLIGGKYQLGLSEITAFEESKLHFIDPLDLKLTNSGIGLITEYENFDNMLSPTKGLRANITYDQFLEFLGSDRNFGRVSAFMHYYLKLNTHWTSGFRVESQLATGNPPFYMLPFIGLRGVPALRYQGEIIALAEIEQQIMLTKRWGINAFGGYGKAINFNEDLNGGTAAWNAGVGFRYLIARLLGLKMGIDVARGPEDWAFYIIVGNAWLK